MRPSRAVDQRRSMHRTNDLDMEQNSDLEIDEAAPSEDERIAEAALRAEHTVPRRQRKFSSSSWRVADACYTQRPLYQHRP